MWFYLAVILGASSLASARTIDRTQGEVCLIQPGERWRCVADHKCTASGPLDTCEAAGGSKVVCCPQNKISRTQESTEPAAQRISAKKCLEYSVYARSELTDDKSCNFLNPLVVGGTNASAKEFPHMVRLGYEARKNNRVIWKGCGGSLISEQFVLTAAHCIHPKGAPSEVKWVSYGAVNMNDRSWEKRKVAEFFTHPEYREGVVYHDIAVLKLERPASLGPLAHPACLDTTGHSHLEYVAIGWGRTGDDIGSLSSNTLQKVALPDVSKEKCRDTYAGLIGLPKGFDEDQMVCAGGVKGYDTCKGDSGGPLQVRLREPSCMYSIVGITSFSVDGCGTEKPAVYTKVYNYLDWIEKIVW